MNAPSLSDADLEAAIDVAMLRLRFAQTVSARRQAWEELRVLIGQRSREQIEWMEEQKGLAS